MNLMKFSKTEDEILSLGWSDLQHNSRLRDEWSSPEEKDLGVLVDEKLNRSDFISDERKLTNVIYLDFCNHLPWFSPSSLLYIGGMDLTGGLSGG